MLHRVVITGLGIISPIGSGRKDFLQAVQEGKNGIAPIRAFDASGYKVSLAAEVMDFDPVQYIDKREARRMDRFCQFALAAAALCMEDANIQLEGLDMHCFGVYIGTGTGGLHTMGAEQSRLDSAGPGRVSPLLVPMMIGNMAAGLAAIRYGLKGPSADMVTACASGTTSIGEAFRLIKHGYATHMLAGGTEAAITPLGMAGFSNLTALTHATDATRASIPFDRERSGFVMGEGAGILLLEQYESAVSRGAHIYAEVLGYGSTTDAYHMTAPQPDGAGAARAMLDALQEGGVTPAQVSYINAHGTSTPANDKTEAAAIQAVLGEGTRVPVSSTKSMMGHLLGAAGAVETAVCALALEGQFLPPNIHWAEFDPECDLNIIPQTQSAPVEYILKNSLGFGGHNATLLLGRAKE